MVVLFGVDVVIQRPQFLNRESRAFLYLVNRM